MADRVHMTVNGKKQLEEELKRLMTIERPQVVKAIEVARGHGDLSENADYSAAKERQGFIEGRIQYIGAQLASAEVIDPKQVKSAKIVFGATVDLINTDEDRQMTYQIVGQDEADIKKSKIAVTSPIARALIGKQAGDEVIVNAPKGQINFEITGVRYE